MSKDPAIRRENASLTRRLLLFTAGSFAFGFALVPLYDVICEAAGIRVNEAPSRMGESATTECFCFTPQDFAPAEQREFTVRFIIDPDLPPQVDRMTLAYSMYTLPERKLAAK